MEFKAFDKIPRLNREVVVTEKIDGTNACVAISDDGKEIWAQSRNRVITVGDDNYGFAKWVDDNKEELLKMGPGHHYGEWWGQGIGRGYGLKEKRFSLFNVHRWKDWKPSCCHLVPVIGTGIGFNIVFTALAVLISDGSLAAPGFMKPEGAVAFHTASQRLFKATIDKDEEYKGKSGGGSHETS